jgi:G3E family GTPase
LGTVKIVVVVDAVRFQLILKALTNPLKNQLNAADIILINKVDEVTPEVVEEVKRSLQALGIEKTVIVTSATEKINLDPVVEAMVN